LITRRRHWLRPRARRAPAEAGSFFDPEPLTKVDQQTRLANTTYFSGAGGLMTDAEDYL
jgi:hypothetical protein